MHQSLGFKPCCFIAIEIKSERPITNASSAVVLSQLMQLQLDLMASSSSDLFGSRIFATSCKDER